MKIFMDFRKYTILCIAALLSLSFASCTKKYYDYIDEGDTIEGSYIETREYTIAAKDWVWNEVDNRYECIIAENDLITEELYAYGTVVGTVYINEKGFDEDNNPIEFEVQKTLPYLQAYNKGTNEAYTLMLGYDIYLDDMSGSVTFYVQRSDIEKDPTMPKEYRFKVAYIWDSGFSE